jgi:hypothetical protein
VTVAEHFALERRVTKLETMIGADVARVRTWIEICERADEPPCRTVADVHAAAELPPSVRVVGRALDLDVLIEAEEGARLFSQGDDDEEFMELSEGVEPIDYVIRCYRAQARQILSEAKITATSGGTQAGKTQILVPWLFRQWLKRGHAALEGGTGGAVFFWIRESSMALWSHAVVRILSLWPSGVIAGKLPTEHTKDPVLHMIDGSSVKFRHAAFGGSRAGTSLRSESVQGLVFDELSAVHHEENWREARSRVAQTGALIATAFTPTSGHWSEELERLAPSSGGAIVHDRVTCFNNPWWPRARVWADLLASGALTATELEEKVLADPDPVAAALRVVVDPNVRRMRFGEPQIVGQRLWHCWDGERFIVRDQELARPVLRNLANCTAEALAPELGRNHFGYALGKDYNVIDGAAVAFQCFGDPRCPAVLIFDEIITTGPTRTQGVALAERYPRGLVICDPTGAMEMDAATNGARSSTHAEELRSQGFTVEPANGYHGNTVTQLGQLDSLNVIHRAMHLGLIYVHARCTRLLKALELMQAGPDGRIKKTSGTTSTSDRISGPGDAMRYGLWPVYRNSLGPGEVLVGPPPLARGLHLGEVA